MRRWFLYLACGLAALPLMAQDSDDNASGPDASSPAVPAILPAGPIKDDGAIHDSIGFVTVRPLPDVADEAPPCFKRVDYLRKHNDNVMAISYLREVVSNGDLIPQYRARAILELADCLAAQHEAAESLCWLKIWMELYPRRPEIGAVAYRVGVLYTEMGIPDLARDAYYLALAHTINEGQVRSADDLKNYTELTVGTLWGLAANEYRSGQWERAGELFARYRQECPSASPVSLEKAAFLQADCYYQLKQTDNALNLYEAMLQQHPFNPLAPEARLRLYHLYMIKNQPEKAQADLEALAWTVRTVWPKEETYWQEQTAQMLLALNQKNAQILPPLVKESAELPPEGKTWQEALNHYDALVSFQANETMDSHTDSSDESAVRHGLPEDDDLKQIDRYMNQLLPAPQTASTQ